MSEEGEMIIFTEKKLDDLVEWFAERGIHVEDWQIIKICNKKEDPKLKKIFEGV